MGSLAVVSAAAVTLLTVALLIAALVGVFRGRSSTLDFSSFYAAGELVRQGREDNLYDIPLQEATQRRVSGGNYDEPLPFALPAFVAYLFVPFTLLSLRAAYAVMLGMNLALLGAFMFALHAVTRSVPGWPRRALLAGTALGIPTIAVLTGGQVDLAIVVALLGGYVLSQRGRSVASGLALAVAFIKPQLALGVLLLLLATRQWRPLGSMLGAGVLLAVVPVAAMGLEAITGNIEALSAVGRVPLMSNWRGFLVSSGAADHVAVWGPGWAMITFATLVAAARCWVREDTPVEQRWAVAFLLPLIISPHVHGNSLVLLFPALALALTAWSRQGVLSEGRALSLIIVLYVALFVRWTVALAGISLGVFLLVGAYTAAVRRWPEAERDRVARRPAELDRLAA